jgi:hypothetical protein
MLSEFADFLKNKSRKDRPAKQDASPRTRPQDEASSSRAGPVFHLANGESGEKYLWATAWLKIVFINPKSRSERFI